MAGNRSQRRGASTLGDSLLNGDKLVNGFLDRLFIYQQDVIYQVFDDSHRGLARLLDRYAFGNRGATKLL